MNNRRALKMAAGGVVLVAGALWLSPPEPLGAWLGGGEKAAPAGAKPAVQQPLVQTGDVALNPLSRMTLEDLNEIVERPLFNPSRTGPPKLAGAELQPVVEQPVEAPDDQSKPEDFTLLAIAGSDETRVALVRWNKTNETYRLKSGQYLSDWQLTAVDLRAVSLQRDDTVFTLKLFDGRKTPPPPPASVQDGGQDNGAAGDEPQAEGDSSSN